MNKLHNIIKLIKVFTEGLIASTETIKRGDIPSYRISKINKFVDLDGSFRYFKIFKYYKTEIWNYKLKKFDLSFSEIFYVGHTENNLSQFKFFYQICKNDLDEYDYPSENNNLSFMHGNLGIKKTKSRPWKLIFFIILYFLFITRIIKLNKTSFMATTDYIKNFLLYYKNFKDNPEYLPSLAIFANDHNPNYIAISKIMKFNAVKRLYLQHGGVSPLFPKLDFEFTVLFDNNSKNIYLQKGLTDDDIFTISRDIKATYKHIKPYNKEDTPNIVLLLTSILNIDNVNVCIDRLISNKKIGKIYFKPHPRFKELNQIDNRVIFINDLEEIDENFIPVVGNSTIALEMVLKGYNVFQCFEFDDIGHDYYGYLNNKIINELTCQEMSTSFWMSSHTITREALTQYCPHLSNTQNEQKTKFLTQIKSIIKNSIRGDKIRFEQKYSIFNKKYRKEIDLINILYNSNIKEDKLNAHFLETQALTYDELLMAKHTNNKTI